MINNCNANNFYVLDPKKYYNNECHCKSIKNNNGIERIKTDEGCVLKKKSL